MSSGTIMFKIVGTLDKYNQKSCENKSALLFNFIFQKLGGSHYEINVFL